METKSVSEQAKNIAEKIRALGESTALKMSAQEARIAELEAQTDAEPVARMLISKNQKDTGIDMIARTFFELLPVTDDNEYWKEGEPLYTHPPKQAKAITEGEFR